jgi:hypothetical protein
MKKIYKILPAICILFFIAVCVNAGQEYVGSKTSNKYHYPTCKWVKEIKQHKIIKFSSPDEAKKAGYIPCPTCKPPLPAPDKTTSDKGVKNSDGKTSAKTPDKSYALNILLSSLFLLLLLFVPFLPGLLEIMIDRASFSDVTNEKDS